MIPSIRLSPLSPFIRLSYTPRNLLTVWRHSHSFKGKMEKDFFVCYLSDCCTHLQCACFKKYGWCSQKDLCITPNDTIYQTVTIVTIYQTVIRTQKSVDWWHSHSFKGRMEKKETVAIYQTVIHTYNVHASRSMGDAHKKIFASHQMILSIRLSYAPRNMLTDNTAIPSKVWWRRKKIVAIYQTAVHTYNVHASRSKGDAHKKICASHQMIPSKSVHSFQFCIGCLTFCFLTKPWT